MKSALLAWYAEHGRELPWHRTRDPYAILVSEVMLQQTQAGRVVPRYVEWLERWPTVEALSLARTADVLRAWQGLGYNRRALNLQRAARIVVEEHGGRFPDDVETLVRLPGVGPYTARAVAAIAFGRRVGAVDTNVRRVLGRAVLGVADAPAPATTQALADELVPDGRAGEWTHALMDIGARFCRARVTLCDECPLTATCVAVRSGAVVMRPAARPTVRRAIPFPSTSRWLRGRLLDRARAVPDDGWFSLDAPIGTHGAAAAGHAARVMAAEGLLELHPTDASLARLPR